jgi:hypothetical protein
LINSLLTIIIPCKNSLYGLKDTIENLLDQFKITGTRVLILDLGSDDGSYQYAAQASFEHFKKLKIESIKIDDDLNLFKFIDELRTPYSMVITPGSISKNPDFIFNSINNISIKKVPSVYLKKYPIVKRILPLRNIRNKVLEINCIVSEKNFLWEIGFKNNTLSIHTSQISRGKISIEGKL